MSNPSGDERRRSFSVFFSAGFAAGSGKAITREHGISAEEVLDRAMEPRVQLPSSEPYSLPLNTFEDPRIVLVQNGQIVHGVAPNSVAQFFVFEGADAPLTLASVTAVRKLASELNRAGFQAWSATVDWDAVVDAENAARR